MEITTLLWAIPPVILVAGVIFALKISKGKSSLVMGAVGLTVMITLVAVLLVPAIEGVDDSPSLPPKWQYDDYYEMEDLDSASGSLEIITLGDKEYLHVKSIGDGTYTKGGETFSVTTTKANLDVFVIGGQSNAQYNIWGTGELPDTDPVPAPGTAYYYGTSTHPISTGNTTQAAAYDPTLYDIYSSVNSSGENLLGNIDGPFSARYYAGSGHKVLTINTGVGGSSISKWVTGGVCYNHAKSVFEDAMDKVDTDLFEISVKSLLWIQGEADAYMSVDTYISDFMKLYGNVTSNSFNADYKLKYALISQTRDGKNAALAQEILADKNGIYLASTAANSFSISGGTLREDGLHYTQKGDNILAKDFAIQALKLWS